MKLISFNVNGIRASATKGLRGTLHELDADILCLQETKALPGQVKEALEGLDGYHVHAHSAERKGYGGTAILSREEPVRVDLGIGQEEHDQEGRVITATFADHIVVNAYVPNSGQDLRRLDYRMRWDRAFRIFLGDLAKGGKPVVFCGDLDVAHQEIDLARPNENRRSAGFSDEERAGFSQLLDSGFIDTFRHLHPDLTGAYSWWSFRAGARARNVGWRIDYFGISTTLAGRIRKAGILPDVHGSDHCPVTLELG